MHRPQTLGLDGTDVHDGFVRILFFDAIVCCLGGCICFVEAFCLKRCGQFVLKLVVSCNVFELQEFSLVNVIGNYSELLVHCHSRWCEAVSCSGAL